jgi:acetylornithine deacetylase ArgE
MYEVTRLLRDLVALPSINPMGRPLSGPDIYEHRVTAYLEDFFRSLGVPYERQPVAPGRDNILAWTDGPDGESGISPIRTTVIFEAHQDTVPTDNMTIEPFAARIENGRLYGRGACDIKGGMAAMLAAFARLVRDKPPGAARVVMVCTVDEEFTFLGAQHLVQLGLRERFPNLLGAIVAEPTQLHIVNAHKGSVRWNLTTTGRACHSSQPEQGVNAIYHMAAVLLHIERYAEELRTSRSDPRLGPPTLSVGRIDGGTSVNIVPDYCRIEIDRRLLPGEEASSTLEHLHEYLRRRLDPSRMFSFSTPWLSAPPLTAVGSEELVARLGAAIDSVLGAHQVDAVPYGTDAAPLAEAGVPSVVFGPGDIARAHTCDEWVSLEEVEQASQILYRLACLGQKHP